VVENLPSKRETLSLSPSTVRLKKKQKIASVGKDVEKVNLFFTAGRNV
jgi:hypothetical protein